MNLDYFAKNLLTNYLKFNDPVTKGMQKDFRRVSLEEDFFEVGRLIERKGFVVVNDKFIIRSLDILKFLKDQK